MDEPSGLATAFGTRSGRVAAFDDHVGAGTVADDATGDVWSFHATSIADATRTIAEGTWVWFSVRPGPVGLEAFGLTRRG